MSRKYFLLSLSVHLVVLVILIVSFEFNTEMPVVQQSHDNANIINAAVINKITPIKNSLPNHPPVKPVVQAEKKPLPPPKPISKPTPPPVVTTKNNAIPLKVEKKKVLVQKKPVPPVVPNNFNPNDLLKDLQKHAELEKKIKQKKLKAAFEKTLQQQAESNLKQQLLNEQNLLQVARNQQMQGVIDKYKALILQTISRNWLIPVGVNKHLSCVLLIRLAPGGMVIDVQLVKSSGDPALDRSARAAVFKSSPLPVPSNKDEFEPFRSFQLKVRPESVLASLPSFTWLA